MTPIAATAAPAEFLASESRLYEEIEALSLRHRLQSIPIHTRPLVRAELAQALVDLARREPGIESDIHFLRLCRELARELRDIGWGGSPAESGPLIDSGRREERFRAGVFTHAFGDFDEDRDPRWRMRDASRIGTRLGFQLWPAIAAYEEFGVTRIRGEREFIDAIAAHSDLELSLFRAGVTKRSGGLVALAGHDRLRWGPGSSGTLLLSDAAGPMTALLIQGTARGRTALTGTAISAIVSRADHAYLAAHRIEAQVGRRWTIGLAEAARYSGDGIDPLYAIGIVPYTLIERLRVREASADSLRTGERANVMVALDLSCRIAPGLALYGEWLVDDFATESADMPDRYAYQVGFRAERPRGSRRLHLLGEYTRVSNFTYSVSYGDNFVLRDRPLGYELGPDVEAMRVESTLDFSRDWQARISGDVTRRGEGRLGVPWTPGAGRASSGLTGTVAERVDIWGDLRWMPRDNVDLSAGVGFRDSDNEGNVAGANRESWLARFSADFRY